MAIKEEKISISAPNFKRAEVWIIGTAPLVEHKFSDKAKNEIMAKQAAGSTAGSKRKRDAKNFDVVYNNARHISFDGWDGIPASAIRNACITACKLVGFKMTLAKLSIFVEADGYDNTEGTPLVKIISKGPRRLDSMVRLATGVCDVTSRPQFLEWGAKLRLKWDGDQFTAEDIYNLLQRAGLQVGICEGRPGSTNSNGMGWGTFTVSTEEEVMKILENENDTIGSTESDSSQK